MSSKASAARSTSALITSSSIASDNASTSAGASNLIVASKSTLSSAFGVATASTSCSSGVSGASNSSDTTRLCVISASVIAGKCTKVLSIIDAPSGLNIDSVSSKLTVCGVSVSSWADIEDATDLAGK